MLQNIGSKIICIHVKYVFILVIISLRFNELKRNHTINEKLNVTFKTISNKTK